MVKTKDLSMELLYKPILMNLVISNPDKMCFFSLFFTPQKFEQTCGPKILQKCSLDQSGHFEKFLVNNAILGGNLQSVENGLKRPILGVF